MEAVIDNKKMWESLIKTMENGDPILFSKELISALKDQGFEYKDGKIVEINETSDFKIEAGKSYMCIKDFVIGGQERFYKGNLYKSDIDECVTDKNGFRYNSFGSDAAEYFRPATEEEIPQDSQRMVSAEAKEALMEDKESGLDPCDGCNGNCYMCEHQEHAEIKRIKKALLGGKESELTEFEETLLKIVNSYKGKEMHTEGAKAWAKELLSIARKQIVSEVDSEQLTENFKQYVLLKEANGCDGPLISLGTDCYKRGIKHCLDEIELKGIVREE